MKKTRFAIVGCGDVANDIGLINRFNRKLRAVACVDLNRKKAEGYAKKYKIPEVYSDYDEMLDHCELDFVYLAVPHYLHFTMISKALQKGLNVFSEKPVTIKPEDAFELCRQCEALDRKIGVNYQYRYDKACYALARAAHKGELGEILYVRCNVPWSRKEAYFKDSAWHASKEQAGGGTLITQASHFLDIALWIIGSRPTKVTGLSQQKKFKNCEVEDLFMGTVETENGCTIEICSSMVAEPERSPTIEVYGSRGTGIYKGDFFPKVKFLGPRIKKEKPPVGGLHAMVGSVEAFRRWMVGELDYAMPVHNSLEVLVTVEALYRAADSGKKEQVDKRYLEFL